MPTLIGHPWPDFPGTYAGLIHTPEGLHHLVLLDDAPDKRMTWSAAMKWAKGIGADLPSRIEALTLFKNLPGVVAPRWHWTNEEDGASYAWDCYFDYGGQNYGRKNNVGSARAVRRFPVDPSILFGAAA